MPIVIGLGTGRSGTQSLAQLIDRQPASVCFHEINPACMKWAETPRTARSMVEEFQAVLAEGPRDVTVDFTRPARDAGLERLRSLETVRTIGDVAFYYLGYAEMLINLDADIRMPCIQRDRAEVVRSFSNAVRLPQKPNRRPVLFKQAASKPRVTQRNHWMDHDGSQWAHDPKWDSLFPKFEADGLEDAIGKYWDFYAAEAARLAAAHPDSVRVFNIDTLNTENGQREILGFCGIGGPHVLGSIRANALPD